MLIFYLLKVQLYPQYQRYSYSDLGLYPKDKQSYLISILIRHYKFRINNLDFISMHSSHLFIFYSLPLIFGYHCYIYFLIIRVACVKNFYIPSNSITHREFFSISLLVSYFILKVISIF